MKVKIRCTPLTNDTLFDGRLICRQYRQGYRFSIDAVLAAHFCKTGPDDQVLDLGTGCGVIGLILAHRNPALRVTCLEFQDDLARLAQDNVLANNMDSRISVIEGDLRSIGDHIPPETFDLVVCNPPYRDPGRGRINPADQKARARHEIDATLEDVVRAAAYAVKNRGRVVFVYPASRSTSLIHCLKRSKLEPKRIQPVYSYPEAEEAVLVLLESLKNGGEEVRILPPLYVYTRQDGPYTDQMKEVYT